MPPTEKRRTPEGHRRDTRTDIRPLAAHIVPRLPRKSGGDQTTPEVHQAVYPTPRQRELSHTCHANAAKTKGHRRVTGGTPGRTSDSLAVYIVPHLPHKSGGHQETPEGHRRDARAYIRPLGNAHGPTPATQKWRKPRDTGGTPGRTSDPLAVCIIPRLPRKGGGNQGTPEGRQGVHPTPWQCTLSHTCDAKLAEFKGHRRDASAYIRPLGSTRCPTPATQTPWQCTLFHACHAKAAETKGHRREAGAYIRPLGSVY